VGLVYVKVLTTGNLRQDILSIQVRNEDGEALEVWTRPQEAISVIYGTEKHGLTLVKIGLING